MKNVDQQYQELLLDILENGCRRNSRSGEVISVFDRNIKINMSDGFPLLTTKKMFFKGSFHEMLWMLKGETNIKYLISNNVHIWDDDAYRFYCELMNKHNSIPSIDRYTFFDKDVFLSHCLKQTKIRILDNNQLYTFGDLGPVYGSQWRNFNNDGIDQIENIITSLRTNPDDRRLICTAWNPSQLHNMALPPCHYNFQLYTRPLREDERKQIMVNRNITDLATVPTHELSLKWIQRSCDFFLGVPFNISGYALLLSIIAHCVNMTTGTLTGSFGDCHIYANHIDAVKEQLRRDPCLYKLPSLKINTASQDINNIQFDDLEIINYESYPKISAPLSVGLI